MATISEKYEFFLVAPGGGATQAYPKTPKLIWKWETNSEGFKRQVISNELVFHDDASQGIADFTSIYPFERNKDRCKQIQLIVNKICGSSSSEYWKGFFYVGDCDWNVSACQFSVTPEANDPYQCIIDRWEEKLNLLVYGTPVTIKDTYGSIQYETCTETRTSSTRLSPRDPNNFEFFHATECLDVPNTWAICSNEVDIQNLGVVDVPRGSGSSSEVNQQITVSTTYVREFAPDAIEPPGGGWTAVPDGWARPLACTVVYDDETGEFRSEVERLGEIPNALLFSEVLTNILQEYCPENAFRSNYFGINPDSSAPTNKHYDTATNEYQELYFIPKSELLYYGASDRATATPEVTLKKLLNDLYILFAVRLVEKDGTLYLEHESYFQGTPLLDLTNEDNENFKFYIKGNFKYDYKNVEIPKTEKFLFADLTDEIGDFDLGTIEYAPCSTKSAEPKPYKCEVTTTNISAIVRSGKRDDGRISPNGVALVAAEEKVITFGVGKVSGKSILNGTLTFPYIIENNQSYKRPQRQGKLDNEYLQFTYAWPSRRWKGQFCLSCEDLDLFDPNGRVKTPLAWGEIESAVFNEPDGIMQIQTLHD